MFSSLRIAMETGLKIEGTKMADVIGYFQKISATLTQYRQFSIL